MKSKEYKQLGDELSKQERWEEAEKAYQDAIKLGQKNANIYHLLAKIQEKQGDLEGAIENYRQACILKPEIFRFHKSLADALAKKGDFTQAINAYQEAIKLEPNNSNVLHLLAKIQEKQGETKRCEELLQQGLFSQVVGNVMGFQMKSGWGGILTSNPLVKYVSSVRGNPSWESGKNRVALLTSVRNEGVWLPEWIAYHLALGFDKIIIYANDCTDKSDYLLKELDRFNYIKYIENKLNSVEDAPRTMAYFRALNIDKVLRDYEWAMVIDADEFLVLYQDENIQKFVSRFDDSVDAIGINWRLFGSSGLQSRTDELVIKRFQRSAAADFPSNGHIKSLARIKSVLSFTDHVPVFLPGCNVFIYPDRQPVSLSLGDTNYIDYSLASNHHYVVKSYEEFLIKRERGVGGRKKKVDLNEQNLKYNIKFFKKHEQHNQINSDALKYLSSTQKILDSMLEIPDIAKAYQAVLNWYDERISILRSQTIK